MQTFLLVSSVFAALTAWWMALSNLTARPSHLSNLTYAAFFGAVGSWSTLYAVWEFPGNEADSLFWCKWLMVPASFIGPTFYHWNLVSNGREDLPYRTLSLVIQYLLALVHAILAVTTDWVVAGTQPMFGMPKWPIAGPAFTLFIALYAYGFLWPSLRALPRESHISVRRFGGPIRIANSLYLIACLCGATNLPGWIGIPIPPVGQIFIGPYTLIMAYLDARWPQQLIRANYVATAAWLLIVTTVALLMATLAMPLFNTASATAVLFAVGFIAQAIAVVITPRLRWVTTQLAASFDGGMRDPTSRIKQLAADIHLQSTDGLGDSIIAQIAAATDCQLVCLYWRQGATGLRLLASINTGASREVPGEIGTDDVFCSQSLSVKEPWLTMDIMRNERPQWRQTVDVCVPVIHKEQVGFLMLLGKKRPMSGYAETELNALQSLATALHHALTVHALFEQEAAQRQLIYTGKIAAGIAHNVRNPLAVVRAYLEADDSLEPELRLELHRHAMDEIARIQGMVDGLSALARGELFALAPHDLHRVVATACATQADYLASCRAEVDVRFDAGRHMVLAEGTQITTALSNLLRNSAEEIAKTGVPGRIEFAIDSEDNKLTTLRITDTGRGLPVEIEQAMFSRDLFARTTKKQGALGRRTGYGIGLHSTMIIVNIGHGGQFTYRDRAFRISLQRAATTSPRREQQLPKAGA